MSLQCIRKNCKYLFLLDRGNDDVSDLSDNNDEGEFTQSGGLLVCHLNLLTMKFLLVLVTLVHLFLLLQVHLKVLPGYCLFRIMDGMFLKVSP